MNLRNFTFFILIPLFFCACSDTKARVAQMETSLTEVEEKVDALLTYSNTTHDAITDIDLRMEALEQDAKKRGVPVRIKGVDLAAAKAELDKVDKVAGMNRIDAMNAQPATTAPLQPLANTTQADPNFATPPQNLETTSQDSNALTHLPQDEQALLAQSPTLAAALQNQGKTPPRDLPEKDMSSTPLPNNSRRTQQLTDGYQMAEGISIVLPNTTDEFQYPEHTQTMEPLAPLDTLDNTTIHNTTSQDQAQNIGPITGQNLQAPLTAQADGTLTPVASVPPTLASTSPTSPYTKDTIPEPISLTPKPAQSPAPSTIPPSQANTQNTNTPQNTTQNTAKTNTYDGAMNLYKSRQYADSEKAFDAFLQANPNSPLAPNALYWKGETYYARALYPQAIFAFKEVQTRYPKHSKAPDSLLKTAMSYEKLGDTENANLHYTVLVEDFPSSSAAKRAPK